MPEWLMRALFGYFFASPFLSMWVGDEWPAVLAVFILVLALGQDMIQGWSRD